MKTAKTPIDILKAHFENLQVAVPEVYTANAMDKEERLVALIKRTLSIVEAVYFQNESQFTLARMEEYGKVIEELKLLGHSYFGSEELLEKAASAAILNAKLPMKKATGPKAPGSGEGQKQAI